MIKLIWFGFSIGKVLRVVCASFPSPLQLTLAAIMFLWVYNIGRFDVMYVFSQRMGLDRSIYGYYNGALSSNPGRFCELQSRFLSVFRLRGRNAVSGWDIRIVYIQTSATLE